MTLINPLNSPIPFIYYSSTNCSTGQALNSLIFKYAPPRQANSKCDKRTNR